MTRRYHRLRIDSVSPNRRIACSADIIEALCVTIGSGNRYDPIEVLFDGDRFRILDGEKRYRACKILGMTHIEAVIVEQA